MYSSQHKTYQNSLMVCHSNQIGSSIWQQQPHLSPSLFHFSVEKNTNAAGAIFLRAKRRYMSPLSSHSPSPPYLITAFYVVIRRMEYPIGICFFTTLFLKPIGGNYRAISHHFPWCMISLKISINYYTGHTLTVLHMYPTTHFVKIPKLLRTIFMCSSSFAV